MKIVKNTIESFTEEFDAFSDKLKGFDYVPILEGATFCYEENDIFTTQDLLTIYPSDDPETKDVQGTITLSNYQQARQNIRYGLSFVSEGRTHGFVKNEQLIKKREEAYWSIVHKHFPFKPVTVFAHEPDIDSYFGQYVMWHFVYIFLRAGEGVVLAGQAWD